jgi:hypothetical protein
MMLPPFVKSITPYATMKMKNIPLFRRIWVNPKLKLLGVLKVVIEEDI